MQKKGRKTSFDVDHDDDDFSRVENINQFINNSAYIRNRLRLSGTLVVTFHPACEKKNISH